VESGTHLSAIIDQAIVGPTELQQNTVKGFERGWRIWMQLARAHYTVPQRISWIGDDGAYKEREWMGADLVSGADIKMKPGSLSMFSKTMKTELIGGWSQLGWIGPQEAKALVAGNIQATVGARDNEHRLRVRRQIAKFENGPPDGWQPPPPPKPPPPAPPPQEGQPPQPPPQPEPPKPDPLLAEIFASLPVDLSPEVAMIREYEMGRAMASARFQTFPPEWQKGLTDSYTVMRKAAGIFTLEEQQEAEKAAKEAEEKMEQQRQQAMLEQQNLKLLEGQIKAQAEIIKTQADVPEVQVP
jgi:hypothetical protein